MVTIYKHEIRDYCKSLFIWALCVGGMGAMCILLFPVCRRVWRIWRKILPPWERFRMRLA